jgi:hypothetical protein
MARTYDHIIGPIEGYSHLRVTSAAKYLSVQSEFLARNRAAGEDAHPHEATNEEKAQASEPFINIGQWKMRCACNDAPSVSVEWDLACCFECGAIYRNLSFPADRASIEAVLLCRGRRGRNWEHPETLADLIAQNIEAGDVAPDGL